MVCEYELGLLYMYILASRKTFVLRRVYHLKYVLFTLYTQSLQLRTLTERSSENVVGKGEYACNQYFLRFSHR